MGSGKFQLVSYGRQDNLFYKKPTITYFKTMYKKHTNFVIESIPQQFNIKPDFGKRVTCIIGDIADLLGQMYLNVNLPPIGKFLDLPNETGAGNSEIACCAWGYKPGYRIIKNIEFELDDKVIERHTSDWFNVYEQLTVEMGLQRATDKMIGNVDELCNFSNSKNGYLLTIPLLFWFNRHPNMAFPIIAAYNTKVKINVEFNTLENCLLLGPTHYIEIEEDICLFTKEQVLYQNVNGKIHYMKFIYYDELTKRMYYIKVTNEEIKNTHKIQTYSNISHIVTPVNNERLYLDKKKYFSQTLNLALGHTYLTVDYVFLGIQEKRTFLKHKLKYVINIMQYDNEKNIYHTNAKMKINYSNPCTEFLFNCSQEYLQTGYMKDMFNYGTDIFGKNEIIKSTELYMNGQPRYKELDMIYFNKIQSLLYHKHPASVGLGTYSFCLNVDDVQPSGYCNLSKIPDIEMKVKLNKNASYDKNRPIKFRIYSRILKLLTIDAGLCELQ